MEYCHFCFISNNSFSLKKTIIMNGLELTENLASYMSKVDDSILITSPIFTPRYTKGQIGLQIKRFTQTRHQIEHPIHTRT